MNTKHRKTLEKIFLRPTASDIKWRDAVSLVKSLGGDIDELRAGSRVGFELNGIMAVFHKPHPANQMKKGAVESMRNFLMKAGVMP